MTGKVFISYRRDDSAGHAGRVHDRLELEFGRDLLFMDVDAVPLGMNFIKILDEAVAKCDALLAVIGPNWLDLRDKEGSRRLDDPHDYVRIEIAAALQRDIPVIPVLLDGAEIPRVDQLPQDIEELALRNGLFVRHASFHNDMDRLIAGLRAPLGQLDAPPVPATRRSSTQERAGRSTAERRVAPGAAEQEQEASASAPWLRPATIAFGSVIVLAGAIFGLGVVKGPPGSSSQPPISPMQSVPQLPKKTAQLPTAPVEPSPQATPKSPETTQPPPQPAQPPAAPVGPSPQVVQQPSAESQPAPQATQYSTASAPPALKSAQPPFEPLSSIAERALQPGDSFKECDGCPEMVVLPAGAFTMGSPETERGRFSDESPQHVVTFTRPFALASSRSQSISSPPS